MQRTQRNANLQNLTKTKRLVSPKKWGHNSVNINLPKHVFNANSQNLTEIVEDEEIRFLFLHDLEEMGSFLLEQIVVTTVQYGSLNNFFNFNENIGWI